MSIEHLVARLSMVAIVTVGVASCQPSVGSPTPSSAPPVNATDGAGTPSPLPVETAPPATPTGSPGAAGITWQRLQDVPDFGIVTDVAGAGEDAYVTGYSANDGAATGGVWRTDGRKWDALDGDFDGYAVWDVVAGPADPIVLGDRYHRSRLIPEDEQGTKVWATGPGAGRLEQVELSPGTFAPVDSPQIEVVEGTPGGLLAYGHDGLAALEWRASPDGHDWVRRTLPDASLHGARFTGLVPRANGMILSGSVPAAPTASATEGAIWRLDGSRWVRVSLPREADAPDGRITVVGTTHGGVVAYVEESCSSAGGCQATAILWSPDGASWEVRELVPNALDARAVTDADRVLVLVARQDRTVAVFEATSNSWTEIEQSFQDPVDAAGWTYAGFENVVALEAGLLCVGCGPAGSTWLGTWRSR